MRFAAGNAQHIGARPQQQDAFGFSDPSDGAFVAHGGFLGIVADGVGGLTHGSEASQSAVQTFLQAYHLKSPGESIPDALARSLREANQAVLRVASEPSAEGAGTTLAAAVLHDQSLYWISAGDSRIYLLHDNQLTRVTSDHTYGRQLDEQAAQGRISRAEAHNNSERGSLTSYLGQTEPKEVDRNTRPLALQPDDSVFLCSDGFYRALDESEMVEGFRGGLQQGCEALVRQVLAKQRKGQDNLTVIALQQRRRSRKWWADERGRRRLQAYASTLMILALLFAGVVYWRNTEAAKAEAVKAEAAKAEAAKAETAKAEAAKKDAAKAEAARKDAAKAEAAKAEAAKKDAAKAEAAKAEAAKKEAAKAEAAKAEAAKKEAAKAEAAKAEAAKAEAAKAEAAKKEAAKAEAAKAEAAKADAKKTDATKTDATKTDATNTDTTKTDKQSAPNTAPPGQNPASAPNSGGDQQEPPPKPPPTTPPTTPPTANGTKPKGAPNLSFGGMMGAMLRRQRKNDFRVHQQPSWAHRIKDGEDLCHS